MKGLYKKIGVGALVAGLVVVGGVAQGGGQAFAAQQKEVYNKEIKEYVYRVMDEELAKSFVKLYEEDFCYESRQVRQSEIDYWLAKDVKDAWGFSSAIKKHEIPHIGVQYVKVSGLYFELKFK